MSNSTNAWQQLFSSAWRSLPVRSCEKTNTWAAFHWWFTLLSLSFSLGCSVICCAVVTDKQKKTAVPSNSHLRLGPKVSAQTLMLKCPTLQQTLIFTTWYNRTLGAAHTEHHNGLSEASTTAESLHCIPAQVCYWEELHGNKHTLYSIPPFCLFFITWTDQRCGGNRLSLREI